MADRWWGMERGGQAGPYGVGPYDTSTIAMGGVIVTWPRWPLP